MEEDQYDPFLDDDYYEESGDDFDYAFDDDLNYAGGYPPVIEDTDTSPGGAGMLTKLVIPVLFMLAAYFVFSGSAIGKAKVSWYWPPLLGTNCGRVVGNECVSATASGEPWQALVGKNAIACPAQFKFGALVLMDLGEAGWQVWTCKDRGGAIVDRGGNVYWVDMLVQKPVVPFGTEVTAVFLNLP